MNKKIFSLIMACPAICASPRDGKSGTKEAMPDNGGNLMKRNKVTFCLLILFFCLGMVFVLQPLEVQAASKAATASNGKYIYYSCYDKIYRMDTNTGKTKTIVKSAYVYPWSQIVYHKGYLYFDSESPDGAGADIYRVKSKGGKIKELAKGSGLVVYNKKIYYCGRKFDYGEKGELGVYRMDLNGKHKKKLLDVDSYNIAIANNRIYYNTYDNVLYSASLTGTDRRQVSAETVYQFRSDGRDIYYATGNAVHRIIGKNGKDVALFSLIRTDSFGDSSYHNGLCEVRNGVVYFEDSGYKLKKYIVKNGKTVKLKSFKLPVYGMIVGKGKYAVIYREIPYKGNNNSAIGRIKTNGKGYKTLKKYFLS